MLFFLVHWLQFPTIMLKSFFLFCLLLTLFKKLLFFLGPLIFFLLATVLVFFKSLNFLLFTLFNYHKCFVFTLAAVLFTSLF